MERLGKLLLKRGTRELLKHCLLNRTIRSVAISYAARQMAQGFKSLGGYVPPKSVARDKQDMVIAMLSSIDRGLAEGLISKSYWKKFFDSFVCMFVRGYKNVLAFREKYKMEPPGFVTISPTHRCNLKCEGCYSSSSSAMAESLPYEIFTRIIREQKDLWGSHFTVISGGEPFTYKDNGKSLIDVLGEHRDSFFQIYTNGTLITPPLANELAEVANATPAISLEGFEKETDERRGRGTFKKILRAMGNLRKAQVPFGISVTATRKNIDLLLDEKFWDFWFDEQGALYAWLFQYMPIGRAYTLDLMITPEQRMASYEVTWRQIREKKRFIADFWNCGTVSNGCISAGVRGGYLHIDWNGVVTPCVFNPYSTDNIIEIYRNGGTLTDVLFSPFFVGIRNWQRAYVYDRPPEEMGNVIATCPIRDHYDFMYELIKATNAQPEDEQAREALMDECYRRGLIEYGKRFKELSNQLWVSHYLRRESGRPTAEESNVRGKDSTPTPASGSALRSTLEQVISRIKSSFLG